MAKNLEIAAFQASIDGNKIDLFFLENENGIRAAITNYGARIAAIWVPDRRGELDNITAGYDSISGYLNHEEIHLGATVGRYANRIGGASFKLNGKNYRLPANDGKNQLHGGERGFHNAVWEASQNSLNKLKLEHISPDGNEGFPGTLKVEVLYTLSDADELLIEYRAESDKDTIMNVTNHTYFNLGGESNPVGVADHYLELNAEKYTPAGHDLIPTGEIASVEDTPFDFRNKRKINDNYDQNFVLNKKQAGDYLTAAEVSESKTGRKLNVKTTEPGIQLYTCKFKKRQHLNIDTAFCLETQHFPDSPNKPNFPSTVLKAGEKFYSKTAYQFSAG